MAISLSKLAALRVKTDKLRESDVKAPIALEKTVEYLNIDSGDSQKLSTVTQSKGRKKTIILVMHYTRQNNDAQHQISKR